MARLLLDKGVAPDNRVAVQAPKSIAKGHEQLAAFKTPKRVIWVDELPRNAMGKVKKNLLRQTYAEQFQ